MIGMRTTSNHGSNQECSVRGRPEFLNQAFMSTHDLMVRPRIKPGGQKPPGRGCPSCAWANRPRCLWCPKPPPEGLLRPEFAAATNPAFYSLISDHGGQGRFSGLGPMALVLAVGCTFVRIPRTPTSASSFSNLPTLTTKQFYLSARRSLFHLSPSSNQHCHDMPSMGRR